MIRRYRGVMSSGSLPAACIACWLLLALYASTVPLDIHTIHLDRILEGPDREAWLGYDELGRSVLPRLIMGARTSLLVAFGVVLASCLLGTGIGMLSAWLGGWIERLIVMCIDGFMAFPGLLLAIAFAGLLGPGIGNTALALTIVGWVGFARLARAQTLSVREYHHVEAARALGSSQWYILRRHILPLIAAPLAIEATFALSSVVIAEASLSFLGLGVQAPAASWGTMIREGARYMLVAPHNVLAPGVAIFLVVLSVNLCGDRLRDRLDPTDTNPH